MKIFIKTLAGTTLPLDIEPSETVGGVKEKVLQKWGAPPQQQRLTHVPNTQIDPILTGSIRGCRGSLGRRLDDDSQSVAQCGIKEEDSLFLALRIAPAPARSLAIIRSAPRIPINSAPAQLQWSPRLPSYSFSSSRQDLRHVLTIPPPISDIPPVPLSPDARQATAGSLLTPSVPDESPTIAIGALGCTRDDQWTCRHCGCSDNTSPRDTHCTACSNERGTNWLRSGTTKLDQRTTVAVSAPRQARQAQVPPSDSEESGLSTATQPGAVCVVPGRDTSEDLALPIGASEGNDVEMMTADCALVEATLITAEVVSDGSLHDDDTNQGTASTPEKTNKRKKGLCPACGIKTHKMSVFKRSPVTSNYVYKGICIKCNPTSVPTKVLQDYECLRNANSPAVSTISQPNTPGRKTDDEGRETEGIGESTPPRNGTSTDGGGRNDDQSPPQRKTDDEGREAEGTGESTTPPRNGTSADDGGRNENRSRQEKPKRGLRQQPPRARKGTPVVVPIKDLFRILREQPENPVDFQLLLEAILYKLQDPHTQVEESLTNLLELIILESVHTAPENSIFLNSDAVEAVLYRMFLCAQNLEVQQLGCSILATFYSIEIAPDIFESARGPEQSIHALINAFNTFPDDSIIQSQVCKALSKLTANKSSLQLVCMLGGLEELGWVMNGLGQLMSSNLDSVELVELTLSVVARLTAAATAELLVQYDIVNPVLAVLGTKRRMVPQIQIIGMQVLRSILKKVPDPDLQRTVFEMQDLVDRKTPRTSYAETESDAHAWLGVSVHWLKHGLLEEVSAAGLDSNASIYDLDWHNGRNGVIRTKGESMTSPVDGKIGAAYVHCLEGDIDKVGPANFMLSYSWAYSIGDIVDTLWDFCSSSGLDPRRTYVWICSLCVNQHRVVGKTVPFHEFRDLFNSRVTGIGHLLAMMSPWYEPIYVTRVWCVFELYTASLVNDGIKVSIVMPAKERRGMSRKIGLEGSQGIVQLYQTLGRTKVENAMASQEEDRRNILAMVANGPGFRALNLRVNDLLRRWVKDAVLGAVKLLEKDRIEAKKDEPIAREIFDDCQEAGQSASDSKFADVISNIGVLFQKNGESSEALECHKKAAEVYQSVNSQSGLAKAFTNIGNVLQGMGLLPSALERYQKALSISVTAFGDAHIKTAPSLYGIASVLLEQSIYDDAHAHGRKALAIQESALGINHADTGASYDLIGMIDLRQGDYDSALQYARKGLRIREATLGVNNPETADSYHALGMILRKMGNDGLDFALEHFQNALAIREAVLGVNHRSTIESYEKVQAVLDDLEGLSQPGISQVEVFQNSIVLSSDC